MSRLPQLLSPDRYHSAESHDLEMRRVFRPAWHCIELLDEDRVICNQVQHGLAAARFPGVLGHREERVHAFQEYVARLTACASGADYASV